jgi:TonB family protein
VRERDGRQRNDPHEPGRKAPSGIRAIGDALRSIPERLKRPESLLMMLALFASIGVHMPPYLGLGALADYFEAQERAQKKEPAPPVEFEVLSEPTSPDKPRDEVAEPEPVKPPPERDRPKRPEPEKKKAPEPEPKVVKVEPTPQPPLPDPPKAEERKQSITQKSEDPSVEPPPDAKYLAEESRRVEEETVASVTSETKNDPDPQASAPQDEGPEKSGDSREQERGAERGARNEKQQQQASRQRSTEPASPRPPPPAAGESGRAGQPTPTPSPRAETTPETVVRDPLGSFVLAPSNPTAGRQPAAAKPGQPGPGTKNPIKVSWRAFEETFGAEQLAQDRMPREAKRRGAGREKRWDEFRAAIENYIVGAKPGNKTALNAAADPFAAYLAAFHRNLHMEFAHDFLAGLPMTGDLANLELVTKVEIVVNADGTLDRVGVVKSSGNLMYDFGAFNAVQRGAPYPPTPEKIRSPDGRVYMHWALHRNESQCGTWNAEPYILKNPPRSPNDPRPDNVSPYRRGGDTEHGSDEPKRRPGKVPSVGAGETLGLIDTRPRIVRG